LGFLKSSVKLEARVRSIRTQRERALDYFGKQNNFKLPLLAGMRGFR